MSKSENTKRRAMLSRIADRIRCKTSVYPEPGSMMSLYWFWSDVHAYQILGHLIHGEDVGDGMNCGGEIMPQELWKDMQAGCDWYESASHVSAL